MDLHQASEGRLVKDLGQTEVDLGLLLRRVYQNFEREVTAV